MHCERRRAAIIVAVMSGPKDEPAFGIRAPVFAGTFYPKGAAECRRLADGFVSAAVNGTRVADAKRRIG